MTRRRIVRGAAVASLLALCVLAAAASLADTASDDRTRQRIQMRLSGQVGLEIETLGLEVHDGTVRLTGSVPCLGERNRAARLVGGIVGVRTLVNDLVIRPTDRSELSMRQDVLREIGSRPRFQAGVIQVGITGSTVTLSGTVERGVDRLDAEEIAADVHGVSQVINNLQVRSEESWTPETIRNRVIGSLTNPLSFNLIRNLEVSVEEGVVTLKGVAVRDADRIQAERLALGVPGVTGVINLITLAERS